MSIWCPDRLAVTPPGLHLERLCREYCSRMSEDEPIVLELERFAKWTLSIEYAPKHLLCVVQRDLQRSQAVVRMKRNTGAIRASLLL